MLLDCGGGDSDVSALTDCAGQLKETARRLVKGVVCAPVTGLER